MSSRILILGAAGRLGYAAAGAFRDAGWTVASQVRPGAAARAPPGHRNSSRSTRSTMPRSAEAAHGADVVLHALNPPYPDWSRHALPLAYSAITAAETGGRDAALSRQSLQLRLAAAAGDRRDDADAADLAQGATARGDRGAHGGGRRARRAGDHPARRRFLRRRARLMARPGDRQGDRQRPPHLSGTARSGARMGLSARSRSRLVRLAAMRDTARARSRRSAFPAMR